MRHIGSLENEAHAAAFQAYLTTQQIRCMVEPEDGQWAVWIYEEDQIERGREELAAFANEPDAARYQAAVRQAESIQAEATKKNRRQQKKQVDLRRQWENPLLTRCRVTLALIVISVGVVLSTSDFKQIGLMSGTCTRPSAEKLLISEQHQSLPEVRSGEIWRLVTPIFLHFGIMHILFNMMMLRSLGMAIEFTRNSRTMLALVLFTGVSSNLAQVGFSDSPVPFAFGGMSGVVYGLLGYIWCGSRVDLRFGLRLPSQTVQMMIIWLLAGFFDVIPHMANWAHLFGLLSGAVFAYAPYGLKKLRGGE